MDFVSFFDELVKLGAISDEEAETALKRYQSLKESRPDVEQVTRYSLLGGAVAPIMHVAGNLIKGEGMKGVVSVAPQYQNKGRGALLRGMGRSLGASAVTGAVGMGLVPIVRHWMDTNAERSKLKEYLREHGYVQGGHVLSPGQAGF
jgi:hypothetical protein